jgi:hypothetical protein
MCGDEYGGLGLLLKTDGGRVTWNSAEILKSEFEEISIINES